MSTPFNVRSEAWPRVSALLDLAYDMDEAERAHLLATVIADDADLGAELARLLPAIAAAQTNISSADAAPFTALLSEALAQAAQTESPNSAGTLFGAWTLAEKIGMGGMGEVWRAQRSDGLFNGAAAIKLLRSDLPADKLAARFARERAVLARLNHPNIARLLDAGIANEQAFIVLELVKGEPLLAFAATRAPSLASRVRLIRDIAHAVEHAHSQLVLHRDLKPSNVLVAGDGTVKLLDFGIAAALDEATSADTTPNLTQLTGRGLTLEYAAPEQILGEPTVTASDVYSLGAMLFHLATGQRPFAAKANRAALEYSVVHDEAPRAWTSVVRRYDATTKADEITPPSDVKALNGDLDAIIAKSLRKLPTERYATATAFANDLDAWLTKSPISIRADDRSYRTRLWLCRNWRLAALGGVAVAAITLGLGVSLWQRNVAVNEAARATDEASRASKVADYLGELIQSASPDNHGGNWPTVIALLEQSEKDIDEKFRDDPKTKSLLLERMADTNNALNRNMVALAQYEALLSTLEKSGETGTARAIEVRSNYASMLGRVGRHEDALKQNEMLKETIAALYGMQSEQYGNVLLNIATGAASVGRHDEARALQKEGAAILTKVFPNDLKKRVNIANDVAVGFTRRAMWREAEAALAAVETDFPAFAALGNVSTRDALVQRNNLESIRIRLGKFDAVDARLQANSVAATALLGVDNQIAYASEDLRATLAASEGRFADNYALTQIRIESIRRQKGFNPADRIVEELILIRDASIHDRINAGNIVARTKAVESRALLQKLVSAIAIEIPQPGLSRSYAYRTAIDTAVTTQQLNIAREALRLARENTRLAGITNPERLAQLDRAEAAIMFADGDGRRAVTLLQSRFDLYERVGEGDTPRRATLWVQRALYECSFDTDAAMKSATQARDIFSRTGGTPLQFVALLTYIDARVSGDKARIKAAEEAVDTAYLRQRKSVWSPPHLPSV